MYLVILNIAFADAAAECFYAHFLSCSQLVSQDLVTDCNHCCMHFLHSLCCGCQKWRLRILLTSNLLVMCTYAFDKIDAYGMRSRQSLSSFLTIVTGSLVQIGAVLLYCYQSKVERLHALVPIGTTRHLISNQAESDICTESTVLLWLVRLYRLGQKSKST